MKYALLAYGPPSEPGERRPAIDPALAAVLERPHVVGWVRLHEMGAATSVRGGSAQPILSDGPFIDSKEHLGGVIIVEADGLDAALTMAAELCDHMRGGGGIEVRPILEQELGGA